MNFLESQKSNARISVKFTEETPESNGGKSVVKRSTGNTRVLSFDQGEGYSDEVSPFDTFIQVIEGSAEIIIEGISHFLKTGQILILPARKSNSIKANTGVKMISSEIR